VTRELEVIDGAPPVTRWRWGCGCLGVLGLLLVVTPLLVWRLERGRAARKVAKEIARLQASGQPATTVDVNAAYRPAEGRPDMTREIAEALAICEQKGIVEAGQHFPIVGNQNDSPAPLPGQAWETRPEIEAWLALQADAITTFHKVHEQNGTARYPADYRRGFHTLLPNVQSLRSGARILQLSSRVHLHGGNVDAAVEDILATLALARTLENEPSYISHLVRVAITNAALAGLAVALEHAEVTDGDLIRLQAALRQVDSRGVLQRAMQGERASCLLACQTFGLAEVSGDEAEQLVKESPRLPQDAVIILDYFGRLVEANDESPMALLAECKAIDAEMKSKMSSPLQRLRTPVASMSMPGNVAAVEAVLRGDALTRTADAALACERFRRQEGSWPQSLNALVPAYLPSLPIDPFSGKPLVMKTLDDGRLIYSVGSNQVDDGGELDERQRVDIGFRIGK
jgi:hypothetical protein